MVYWLMCLNYSTLWVGDNEIGICCFSTKHAELSLNLRSNSIDWLVGNNIMSGATCLSKDCCFTTKIQLIWNIVKKKVWVMGSSPGQIKPKTIKLVTMQHKRVRIKTNWLRIWIVCPKWSNRFTYSMSQVEQQIYL